MKIRKNTVILIAFLLLLALAVPIGAASTAPCLVLQITVDQLRGDLPSRYVDRLTEGGSDI